MLYRFLWWALRPLIVLPFRVRFVGVDRVPATGGVILAGNDESYLDPVVIGLGVWRDIHFMAKAELWHHRPLGWLVGTLGAFPVHRGQADRAAIQRASAYLERGEQIGMFPQGTRRHARGEEGLREGAGGAALIALRTGSPVVPVGIAGTDRIRPEGAMLIRFPRLTVAFGEPVDPAAFSAGGRRERVDAATARIMEGIATAHAVAAGKGGGS